MPPGLTHAAQCGSVCPETGVVGQGDPGALSCELVAGSLEQLRLSVACGRIQVGYAGAMGLFDRVKQAIVPVFGHAAQLLHTSRLSVDGIASKPGFASRSHFSHAFNEQLGCSPMELRKQHH